MTPARSRPCPARRTAAAPHRGAGGFTLVELVAVIAVVGIVATVGMSRFASPSPFAGRAAAEQLAATLRHVHRVAVAQRAPLHVRIADRPAAVTVCLDAACTRPLASPDGDPWYAPRQAPRLSGSAAYQVNAMGEPDLGQALELRPADADGRAIGPVVRVEPLSGLVRVQP